MVRLLRLLVELRRRSASPKTVDGLRCARTCGKEGSVLAKVAGGT